MLNKIDLSETTHAFVLEVLKKSSIHRIKYDGKFYKTFVKNK